MERNQNKPFALLGVNGDNSINTLRKVESEGAVTWRSWYLGTLPEPQTTLGVYKVDGFPTLALIDHKGIVREFWEGFPPTQSVDAAVDRLVREAEKTQ